MGYDFYQKFVPAEDLQMLIDINNSGFEFYEKNTTERKENNMLYPMIFIYRMQAENLF